MHIRITDDLDRQFDAALNRDHDPDGLGIITFWDGSQFVGSRGGQLSVVQAANQEKVEEISVPERDS